MSFADLEVGGDVNVWGNKLLLGLEVSHEDDGTLKPFTLVGVGSNPASSGDFRMTNAGWITSRNAGNTGDVNMFRLNASDMLEIGAPLTDTKFRGPKPWIDVRAYGAVIDDSTNDAPAINSAIAAAPASGAIIYCPSGGYVTNTTIDMRDKENVELRGDGAIHDAYSSQGGNIPARGTRFRRTSGTGHMIRVGTSAATTSRMGQKIKGISLDGNSLATHGILVESSWGGEYTDIAIKGCTTVGLDINCLSGATLLNTQDCKFDWITVTAPSSCIGVRIGGTNGQSNTSFCEFGFLFVTHVNGVGVQLNDADSNVIRLLNVNKSTGTGIGVEFNGRVGAGSSGYARANQIIHLAPGPGGVTSRGSGLTAPAINNAITVYNKENSAPDPVIEAGSSLYWNTDRGAVEIAALNPVGAANIPVWGQTATALDGGRVFHLQGLTNTELRIDSQSTSGVAWLEFTGKDSGGVTQRARLSVGNSTEFVINNVVGTSLRFMTGNTTRFMTTSAYAVDTLGATLSAGAMRMANAQWITARNAANSADVNVIRVNSSDQVEIGTGAPVSTFNLSNNTFIKSRNAANTADVNMMRINTLDYMEIPVRVFRDDVGTSGNWTDLSAFLAYRRNYFNVAGGTNGAIHVYGVHRGMSTVSNRGQGIYIRADDHSTVANRTITGMSRVGTTITVTATAHGYLSGDSVNIYGVTHTFNVEVNAAWTISNVTANTFDITVPGLSSGTYTSGGTASNRPMMYGLSVNVAPLVDRGPPYANANSDDVNCFAAYNLGPGKATEAFYVGRNSTSFPSSPEWDTGFTSDPYVKFGLFKGSGRVASGGAIFRGQDATVDSGGWGLTLPNNVWIGAKNAGGTVTNMMKMNSSDLIEFGTNVIQLTGDTRVGGFAPSQNDPQLYVRQDWTATPTSGGNQSTGYFYAQASGAYNTGHFLYNVLSQVQDAASVTANKTITNMVRSGGVITVTATAHGYSNGNRVIIDNAVHTFNVEVNGSYVIANVTANTFEITPAGLTSGTWTSGGIVTNRPAYFAHLALLGPTVARGGLVSTPNIHADDVGGYFVSNNGTAKATDPFYVGRNPGLATEWDTCGSWDGAATMGIMLNNIVGQFQSFRATTYGSGTAPEFQGRMGRGTFEAPRRMKSGDASFILTGKPLVAADDTTNAVFGITAAKIHFQASQDQTATAQGHHIIFSTTQANTASLTERFRVTEAGGIDFQSGTFPSGNLMRLKPTFWIAARNNANTADLNVMRIDSNDKLVFGTTLTGAGAYTVSNVTTDRTFDANATTMDEMADVLGTLIADLKAGGLLP